MGKLMDRGRNGFTLLELLVVVAILGVLAVVLVAIINPAERIAQARDTGRISGVVQLGRATESFYIRGSTYPDPTQWDDDLVATGYPNRFPSGIPYLGVYGIAACATNALPSVNPTFCYDLDISGNDYGVIVFSRLEARTKTSQCPSGESAYFVYSSEDKRSGTICGTSDPVPWAQGSVNYID